MKHKQDKRKSPKHDKSKKHSKHARDSKHADKHHHDHDEKACSERAPDHRDAELVLRLYDLRREPVMRASRTAIVKFLPRSYDDVAALLKPDHPDNAAWRQVSSYFEMAYSFARNGIVPADFLAENAGEGLLLFAKIAPYLEQLRADTAPTALRNAEWLVEHSEYAANRVEVFKARIAKQLASS